MAKKRPEPARKAPSPARSSAVSSPKIEKKSAPNSTREHWLIGLGLAAFAFLLYANTLGHQWALDDYSAIKDNWVTKGGLKNIGTIFSTEYRYGAWNSPGSLYRPLALTMFAAEWSLSPDKPFLSHFMNLVFYAATGMGLFFVLKRVLGEAFPAAVSAAAAAIFIAHPVHSEVVSNIKSRDEIVSFLACLFALYCIWRSENGSKWTILGLLSYTAAMFTKEGSVMFLFAIPLFLWFFTKKTVGEVLSKSWPYALPVALFILVRARVIGSQKGKEAYSALDNFIVASPDLLEQKASAFLMCGKYLEVLFAPIRLSHEYGFPQFTPVSFGDAGAIFGLLAMGGLLVFGLFGLPKRHPLAFCALYFLTMIALVCNVFLLIGTSYGERLLYAPSLGLALAVPIFLHKALRINELQNRKTIFLAAVGLIVAAFSIRTFVRNPAWWDSYKLYASDISTAPRSAKMNYHLGLDLTKQGIDEEKSLVTDTAWVEKGIRSYTRAIELFPTYHDAYSARGLVHFRKGQTAIAQKDSAAVRENMTRAMADYEAALKHRPGDSKTLSNMGFIYFLQNDLRKAEEVYRKAIASDPRFVDARRNLGAVLAMQKRYPEAIEHWKEALKYEPNSAVLKNYIETATRDMNAGK